MQKEDSALRQSSVTTMIPKSRSAQISNEGFRLQSGLQYFQNNAQMNYCQCRNGMGIFERSVEDQGSDVWYSDTSEEEKSDMEEEFDLSGDGGNEGRFAQKTAPEVLGNEIGNVSQQLDGDNKNGRLSISPSANCSNMRGIRKQQLCTRCGKVKTGMSPSRGGFDPDDISFNRPRTNSIILQLSRETTRQSFLDSTNAGLATSSDGMNQEESSCRLRTRSSFIAIPTHIYSLEKYVGTELDSAAESFFDKDVKLSASSPIGGQSSIASPTYPSCSSISSHSNVNDKLSPPPLFLEKRKRRKSHIELSLSVSFQS
ncbi:HHR151Cp [Eremothecium sinecaudum]|uniref:HHR151Cp n=1 Tax=Eremothecium sinecaudum TaxID=45286 RepID=A0A109V0G4_9SACH|nr:HHR151Cp [Eremothecium sinecaudum]AMD22920.1 HHR151Cp [Eremothecium sinecaudum]